MSRQFFTFLVGLTTVLTVTVGCSNQLSKESLPKAESEADAAQDDAAAETKDEANTVTLTIGTAAPRLELANWVQGEPIDGFQPGHTYVVEFWATWCGPCRANMPHMSELQKRHQGKVTFIGVTSENEETVTRFLDRTTGEDTEETWRDVATYPLVLDSDRATTKAYMNAAGLNGIPTAFVVGPDAHIEWIGHPANIEKESLLEKIVAGTWDREEYLARHEEEQRKKQAMQTAMLSLRKLQQNGDWVKAVAVIDDLIAQNPAQRGFDMLKLSYLMRAQQFYDATTFAEQLAEDHWESPYQLNEIAWTLASQKFDPAPRLQIALRLAKRASELKQDQDASVLDTIARVYYELGDLDEAIAWQEKAVEFGKGNEVLEKTLLKYLVQRDGEEATLPTANVEVQADTEESAESDEQAGDEVEPSQPKVASAPVVVDAD